MKSVSLLTIGFWVFFLGSSRAQSKLEPLIIQKQGSFAVGGTVVREPGNFDQAHALQPHGQTLHGDHAYVFYQIPVEAKSLPLLFLHGAGQSKKTWETTADGREGFQNIFLRRKYPVYLLDQPRRGEAGKSTVGATLNPIADEQFWFTQFRLGIYPDFFPGVQFPKDPKALEQFYRQMTPNTGDFDPKEISTAVSELFKQIGAGILITHSQAGGIGWNTAIQQANVKAIVAFEPYSGFVFPEEELPNPISSSGLFGALNAVGISKTDFLKLCKIPILLYYGDNIADKPTSTWNKDHWRSGLEMAYQWTALINKYGGDARVVHLPKIGIYGNTHFPFADLNNVEIADHLSNWLKEKNLDK